MSTLNRSGKPGSCVFTGDDQAETFGSPVFVSVMPTGSSGLSDLTSFNGKLYFTAFTDEDEMRKRSQAVTTLS